MNKMTEDNCRIGDPKVMTNTKGAPENVMIQNLPTKGAAILFEI